MPDVRDVMFRQPLADDGKPLWDSQRALARSLVSIPSGGYHRKPEESVRVFLSQVLKPAHETGSRPVSTNLRRSIPLLVAKRIADAEEAKSVSTEILRLLDRLKDPAAFEQPASDELEWGALYQASMDPQLKHVVIITDQPAETQADADHAPMLTEALLKRVVDREGNDHDREAIYDFFITDRDSAIEARASLVNQTASYLGLDYPAAEKLVTSAEKAEQLNMYFLNYDGFLPPMCVFEPLSRCIGFNLYYHSGSSVSVARMNDISLRSWKSKFYVPLISKKQKPFSIEKMGAARSFDSRSNIYLIREHSDSGERNEQQGKQARKV
jgi:hypothetical protein